MTNYFCETCLSNRPDRYIQPRIKFNLEIYNEELDDNFIILENAMIYSRERVLVRDGFNLQVTLTYYQTTANPIGNIMSAVPLRIRSDSDFDIISVTCDECGSEMHSEEDVERLTNPLLRRPNWAENIRESNSIESIHRFSGCNNYLKVFHIAFLLFGLSSGKIIKFSVKNNEITHNFATKDQLYSSFIYLNDVLSSRTSKIVIRKRKNIRFKFENRYGENPLYIKESVNDISEELTFSTSDFLSIPFSKFKVVSNSYYLENRDALDNEATRDDVNSWFNVSLDYDLLNFDRLEQLESDDEEPEDYSNMRATPNPFMASGGNLNDPRYSWEDALEQRSNIPDTVTTPATRENTTTTCTYSPEEVDGFLRNWRSIVSDNEIEEEEDNEETQ